MKLTTLIQSTVLALALSGQVFGQTTCDLPPTTVCYNPADGVTGFFDVTITFAPDSGGYVIHNGDVLPGWCMNAQAPIDTSATYCGATPFYSTGALPAQYAGINWGAVNWLINNKGSADVFQIQDVVWALVEGDPLFDPAEVALRDAALLNGVGFVPALGQATAVVLDLGPTSVWQPVFVEVTCTKQPPPPPEQNEYCFTAAEKKTCYGTVDASFILDFGTGSRYLPVTSLRLVPVDDSSATLTGVVYKAGSPSSKFNVVLTLSGYTDPGAQPNWVSYSSMSGTLTGLEGFAGMNLMVSSTGAVQIGEGANGLNPGVGILAPFNWVYTTSSGGGQGKLAGLATECIDITEECLVEYKKTSTTSGHAIYLPGIGTDFIAGNKPLHFIQSSDGTASLTGIVYSASNPSKSFAVNFSLSDFSTVSPDAGGPKLELPSTAYVPVGPIDPTTWNFYASFTGTLTGLGNYAGAVINVSRYGPAFQLGVGANGKNYNPGASAWFTVTVAKQPNNWCYKLCPTSHGDINVDFGECVSTQPPCVGTGTIGYWKTHPEAWPVQSITIGGTVYSKTQAISIMGTAVAGDKTYSMFSQLVAAKLNVLIGNTATCIASTIASADDWMAVNPVGSNVGGSSSAWVAGSPLHSMLDSYNNGLLCAPHRDTLNCGGSTPPPPTCQPKPTCDPKPTCVPNPWKDKNVGDCHYSGSSSHNNGCYTVKGSGCDIWGNKDDCKYVFQNAYGDCEVTAKICSVENSDPWAKCGVMIRESMNSDSKHAFACVTPGNGMAFQRRCNTGGSSEHTSGGSGYCWVKLKRSGNTFSCYKSKDGYNWTKVSDCYIRMGSSCYIGLAVTSHNNSKTCEAKVTNVKICQ